MTSGKPKLSYVVKFVQTEADQDLLLAVEQALEDESYRSFSDLCKQALRRLLLPNGVEPLPMMALLEQQVMTLQMQMMQIEQRTKESQTHTVTDLEHKIQQLNDRVTQLEQHSASSPQPPETPEAQTELDPLLSRLAPFLDDF
jgi:hypothetical protein